MQPLRELKSQFLLDPAITYLNFGSFGACVAPVFEEYQRFQRELELEPSQFFFKNGPRYLKQTRDALGAYLNCGGDDLVMVPNPSYAVNIVARSLNLRPGDEIVTTNLEYGACDKTWQYYAERSGATLKRAPIPLPLQSPDEITAAIFAVVTDKTKLIFISHITSSTALIFPVKEICRRGTELGIPVFVDGAHGPGQVDCDLGNLGATMYTGACHKWMLCPKGTAFLYVDKAWQKQLDPLVVSWGYKAAQPSHSRFLDYHENQGTRDYSAFLTVPAAIRFMKEKNWRNVAASCRQLVQANAARFSEFSGGRLLSPATDDFIAQMLSFPVRCSAPARLQEILFVRFRIEIPVMVHGDQTFVRFSINAFNDQQDLDRLYEALKELQGDQYFSASW